MILVLCYLFFLWCCHFVDDFNICFVVLILFFSLSHWLASRLKTRRVSQGDVRNQEALDVNKTKTKTKTKRQKKTQKKNDIDWCYRRNTHKN